MAFKRHITYILPTLLAASGIALGAQALAAHPHTKPKKKPVVKTAPATPEISAPSETASPESTRIIRRMVKPNEPNPQGGEIEIVEQIEIIEGESGDASVRVIIVDGKPQLQMPGEASIDMMQDKDVWTFDTDDTETSKEWSPEGEMTMNDTGIETPIHGSDDSEPQRDESGMRVIKLTGETIVKVGDDGQLEIYNNGRMIEPMSFAPADQGNMQTQVLDDGENMKLSVKKTVSESETGRKIRVEIDMETLDE